VVSGLHKSVLQTVVLKFVVAITNVFILCINVSYCSICRCRVTSSGVVALGEALKKSKTLEILEYVVE